MSPNFITCASARRRQLIAAGALGALGLPRRGRGAEAWPPGPVTVHSYAASGTTRNLGSLVAAQLSLQLKSDVRLAFAEGAVAATARRVAAAQPDGSHALLVSSVFVGTALLRPDAGYDPLRDFRPVGLIARTGLALVTHPASGLKTAEQALARLREGGALTLGTYAQFTISHAAATQLAELTHAAPALRHYGGQTALLQALQREEVELGFVNLPELLAPARQNLLRPLALAAAGRAPQLPQLPTLSELGVPIVAGPWYGLVLPVAAPDAVAEAFNAALRGALEAPSLRAILRATALQPTPGAPAELGAVMSEELAAFRRLLAPAAAPPREGRP